MYQLSINNSVQSSLDKLSFAAVKRISAKLFELKSNPRPHGCKKLHNEKGYRIRIGDYRVLYEVDDPKKTIIIYKIAHRRDVYR